jgi:BASS family bile acid:Na+ symporter
MTGPDLLKLFLMGSLVLIVFSLGCRVTSEDATLAFRRPGAAARIFLSLFVVMPILVWLAVRLLPIERPLAVVLLALAVAPVPPILPAAMAKAGADLGHAVAVQLFVTLASLLAAPLLVLFLQTVAGVETGVDPSRLVTTLLLTVVLPLGLGLALRAVRRDLAERVAGPAQKFGQVGLLLGAVVLIWEAHDLILAQVGNGTILFLALFSAVGLAVGHGLGRGADRPTLALATAARHPGIALSLASGALPEQTKAIAGIVLLYLLVGILVRGLYSRWITR